MMENITRRTIMKAAVFAGIPAGGVTAFVHDPLADVIVEYRAGVAALNAIPIGEINRDNENALVDATYGPASDLIHYNTPAATSLRGVAESIRYTLDADALVDDSCEKVLRSALAYLESAA